MKYCSNCGKPIKKSLYLCPNCNSDPDVPEEIVNEKLKQISLEKKERELTSKLEYPGESSSLAFSILVMVVIAIIFSTITLGIFLIYLIIGLILLRIRQVQTKTQLVKVSEDNFQEIFKLTKLAAFRLKTPLAPVYVIANPSLNAYTSGFWGDHWIVLHSALVKKLNLEELLYVIGHEMGHIKREHATWLQLTAPRDSRSIPIISDGLKIIFNNWTIKSEYCADRAGLIANKDLESCFSALSMIATGHRNIKLDSFLEESERKHKDPLSILGEFIRTHPYYPNRIRQLHSFNKFLEYK